MFQLDIQRILTIYVFAIPQVSLMKDNANNVTQFLLGVNLAPTTKLVQYV